MKKQKEKRKKQEEEKEEEEEEKGIHQILSESEIELLMNLVNEHKNIPKINDIQDLKINDIRKIVKILFLKYHQNRLQGNLPNKNKLIEISKSLGTIKNKLNGKQITNGIL